MPRVGRTRFRKRPGGIGSSLLFSTTFSVAEGWTEDRYQWRTGISTPPNSLSGVQTGLTNSGTSTTFDGSYDGVITAAGRTGERGFRHWCGGNSDGSGINDNGGGIDVKLLDGFGVDATEIWLRYYLRFQSGFQWNALHYTKDIYWNASTSPFIIHGFFSTGAFYTHCSQGSQNIQSSITFNTINGGSTGDGLYHCYESHIKLDTDGTNGVLEMWVDNSQVYSASNINFGGSATSVLQYFRVGSNQSAVADVPDQYRDFTDIACSITGRVGPL